jgi:hypothetical protein
MSPDRRQQQCLNTVRELGIPTHAASIGEFARTT